MLLSLRFWQIVRCKVCEWKWSAMTELWQKLPMSFLPWKRLRRFGNEPWTTTKSTSTSFLNKVKPKEWEKWLFPTRDGKQLQANVLGRNFRKYCDRTGVKFTPYQIRHSFATFYLENGGDLFTLQRQMGHTDLQMTKRYTEISDKLLVESHQNYSPIGLLQDSSRRVKV